MTLTDKDIEIMNLTMQMSSAMRDLTAHYQKTENLSKEEAENKAYAELQPKYIAMQEKIDQKYKEAPQQTLDQPTND